jgi:putative transposase
MVHIAGAFSIFTEDVTYAMPYHGQSKGRMERFFGTLAGQFSKSISSYVGSNTVTRPEDAALFWRALNKQAQRHDVITWDAFVQELARWIDWYNATWKGEAKGLEGKTPDEVFAALAPPPRTVDDESLALAFSRSEERVVFENGVRMDGVSFYSEDLIKYIGQRVFVRRQIFSKNEVIVSDLKGSIIAKAKADWFKETGDLAADNARVKTARKKVLELVRDSARTMPRSDTLGTLPKMAEALEQEETRLVSNGEELCSGSCRAVADYGRERAFIDLLTEE